MCSICNIILKEYLNSLSYGYDFTLKLIILR